ncbi:MAG: Crp/Fnr family transcriptional regulator [Saprospiraceae bacterium]
MSESAKDHSQSSLEEIKAEAEADFATCLTDMGLESELVARLIQLKDFKKGHHLVKAGQIPNKSYSIVSGCVRQYYIVDGEEKTTFFYTEGQAIFSTTAGDSSMPSKYYLSCMEDSKLTVLTREAEAELFRKIPSLAATSREALKEELVLYQEMLSTYITTTPEQRYENLLLERPDLLQRVPQYHLASYLGVKPESLSRIRKRITSK